MSSVSRLALALGLGAGLCLAVPALAKKQAPAPSGPTLSKSERESLAELQTALEARDYMQATTALAAAQAAARSAQTRYWIAGLQLRLGRETNNIPLQASAVDAMIASGLAPQVELGGLYSAQAGFAAAAGDRKRLESSLTRAMELAPNADAAIALAQVRLEERRNTDAVSLIERAIGLRKQTGQPVPESWYRRAINVATAAALAGPSLQLSREWIAAYPSRENWRDAILTYRDFGRPDPAGLVDSTRLMRLARALGGERDYLEAAQTFANANLPGESRSVLAEGVETRMIDPADPTKQKFKETIAAAGKAATAARARLTSLRTAAAAAATGAPALDAADQHLSFGDYAAAVDLYRLALQKGGVDPGIANMRLGIALALADRRTEARGAFQAVTGPRSDLAALWLTWLAQRA
jgi:tetratricopeptide (TPR) repeat protein